jgi:excisionase family DNA binding protein
VAATRHLRDNTAEHPVSEADTVCGRPGDATTDREAHASRRGRAKPPAPSAPSDRLLGVTEAAELLSIQPRTLYQWAYQRRVPVVKLGRALRFRESDVQRLIRDGYRPALRSPLDV